MNLRNNYKFTVAGCYFGYIVQGVILSFLPLLYVQLNGEFSISYDKISIIITITFLLQLLIDVFSTGFVTKLGYRKCLVASSTCALIGFIGLCFLPYHMDAFTGIIISVLFYSTGCGLIEVLISPLVEACPTKNKTAHMCLLHSFYCWGHMGVVLLSTAFFAIFGIEKWKALALIWAAVPVFNGIFFTRVPIYPLVDEGEKGLTLKQLTASKTFWIMMLMMVCAGASEQSVSQWASAFAEEGLGVSKTIGDLAGPTAFAALMGTSRLIYGKLGHRIDINKFMGFSCILCIAAYLCISIVQNPAIELIGCAVCGFSVGILWPATFSKASASIKGGGTLLFAMLALAGDLGCSAGPTLAGFVSGKFGNNLRAGILAAIVFPALLLLGLLLSRKNSGGKIKKA